MNKTEQLLARLESGPITWGEVSKFLGDAHAMTLLGDGVLRRYTGINPKYEGNKGSKLTCYWAALGKVKYVKKRPGPRGSDDNPSNFRRLRMERDALRAEVDRLRNPSDDMLVAGQEVWARGRIGALEDCEEARAIYMAMIDAAMEAPR